MFCLEVICFNLKMRLNSDTFSTISRLIVSFFLFSKVYYVFQNALTIDGDPDVEELLRECDLSNDVEQGYNEEFTGRFHFHLSFFLPTFFEGERFFIDQDFAIGYL